MKPQKYDSRNISLSQYLELKYGISPDSNELDLISDLAIKRRARLITEKFIEDEAVKLHDQESNGFFEKIRQKAFIFGAKFIRNKFLN